MIFLTVGTQFPFDRLLRAVDDAIGNGTAVEEIYAQIGDSKYVPRNFKGVASLQKAEFDKYLANASAVIGHAGMGTITAALEHNKPLLVMPRLEKFGEVVNDHQVGIAKRFEQAGLLLAAYTAEEIPQCLAKLKTFVPKKRECATEAVVERIARFLQEMKINT
jgi:UDP-N-acetylglucosamine transferase subunit ALG13